MTAAVSISLYGKHEKGCMVLRKDAVTRQVVVQDNNAAPSVDERMKVLEVAAYV